MSQKLLRLKESVGTLTTMLDDLYEAVQLPETTLTSVEDSVSTLKTMASDIDSLAQDIDGEIDSIEDELDETNIRLDESENQKNLIVEVNTGMDMARVYLDNGNLLDRQVFEMLAEAYAGGKTSTDILCHLRLLK